MVLVDTTGCGCEELDTQEDQSKGNKGEAVLAAGRVTALVEAGVPESAVAVITPYNLQVWITVCNWFINLHYSQVAH